MPNRFAPRPSDGALVKVEGSESALGDSQSIKIAVGARTFATLGAGPTESTTADRAVVDLTGRSTCRVLAQILTAFVTGNLKLQYSLDGGGAYTDLTGGLLTPTVVGPAVSALVAIPVAARTVAIIRLACFGGNGAESPIITAVHLETS